MKKLSFLTLLFIIFTFTIATAQVPQAVNYQAVVRSDSGFVLPNKTVNIRLSVQDGVNTPALYSEVHTVTTNTFGLVTLSLGRGVTLNGVFSQISWGIGDKYLKTEVDLNRAGTYTVVGTQQFLSVPYALYAERAGNIPTLSDGWLLTGNSPSASSYIGTNNAVDLRFFTNGTQKMVLKTSGNVGIGTTTPNVRLRVETNSDLNDADRVVMQLHNNSNNNIALSAMALTSGTSGTATYIDHVGANYNVYAAGYTDFNDLGYIQSTGRNGLMLSTFNSNAKIRFGVGISSNIPITHMTLTPTGLGIGTQTPRAKLEVTDGDVYVNNSARGIILRSPNGGCWRVTIDNAGNFIRTAIACP